MFKKQVFQYLDLSSRIHHKELLQFQIMFALVLSKWEAKTAEDSLPINEQNYVLCFEKPKYIY